MTDKHINNQMGLLINILSKSCQRRMREFGCGKIIKADNRNVIWYTIVQMIQRLHQLGCYTVRCTEECGWSIWSL